MPYHIHRLANLFRSSQDKSGFSMIANAYEQSTGLNCASSLVNLDDNEVRIKPGSNYLVDSAEWQSFQRGFGVFAEAQSVRQLVYEKTNNTFCANYSI